MKNSSRWNAQRRSAVIRDLLQGFALADIASRNELDVAELAELKFKVADLFIQIEALKKGAAE